MQDTEVKVRVPCEVWSRVMGYYRPVSWWNVGKKAEYADRLPFAIPNPDDPKWDKCTSASQSKTDDTKPVTTIKRYKGKL